MCDSFDQVIGELYQSVVSDEPWQQFLDIFKKGTGSSAISVQKWRNTELLINVEKLAVPNSQAELNRLDLLNATSQFDGMSVGVVKCLSDVSGLSSVLLEPLKSCADIMAVDVIDTNGYRTTIRLLRDTSLGSYGELEKSIVARMSNHIVRAVNIYQDQLNRSSHFNIYTSTAEQLPLGIIALNDKGRIINGNTTADLILGKSDCLIRDGQQIVLFDSEDGKQLNQLIQSVITKTLYGSEMEQESMRVKRKFDGGYIYVLVRSLQNHTGVSGSQVPKIAVYLSEDETVYAPPVKLLRQLFGLTKAEALLVLHMVRGLSLGDACIELGRSHNTGRSQLSSIFSKVGVNKQAELVRTVYNSVASLALSKQAPSTHLSAQSAVAA